jgi:hypothetical protein
MKQYYLVVNQGGKLNALCDFSMMTALRKPSYSAEHAMKQAV